MFFVENDPDASRRSFSTNENDFQENENEPYVTDDYFAQFISSHGRVK